MIVNSKQLVEVFEKAVSEIPEDILIVWGIIIATEIGVRKGLVMAQSKVFTKKPTSDEKKEFFDDNT